MAGSAMADRDLDLRGLTCPLPVLRARKALMAMRAGERLAVLTSDPRAPGDLAAFCAAAGHRLLASAARDEGGCRLLIERG